MVPVVGYSSWEIQREMLRLPDSQLLGRSILWIDRALTRRWVQAALFTGSLLGFWLLLSCGVAFSH